MIQNCSRAYWRRQGCMLLAWMDAVAAGSPSKSHCRIWLRVSKPLISHQCGGESLTILHSSQATYPLACSMVYQLATRQPASFLRSHVEQVSFPLRAERHSATRTIRTPVPQIDGSRAEA